MNGSKASDFDQRLLQGIMGTIAGLCIVIFLLTLKDKNPPDFIVLGISSCDMLFSFLDILNVYFTRPPTGLGCRILGVLNSIPSHRQ